MRETFKDAYAEFDGETLALGNASLRREIRLKNGVPLTVSLRSAEGIEFSAGDKTLPDFSFAGYALPSAIVKGVKAARGKDRLRVTLEIFEPVQELTLWREFLIYPGLPVMAMRNSMRAAVIPNCYWAPRSDLRETGNRQRFPLSHLESRGDSVKLRPGVSVERTVEFVCRTDLFDEFVKEHEGPAEFYRGNICFAVSGDGAGIFYLQESPPSAERRDLEPYDFRNSAEGLCSCASGIAPWEIKPGAVYHGEFHALGIFKERAAAEPLLKKYLRARFPPAAKAPPIVANPWGCGRFPKLVSEDFLLREIEAAAELGATHYQVDDSWQEGEGLAELTIRNRHITPDFWRVSEKRLGGSFGRLAAAAKKHGVKLSLWTAPDCNTELRGWRGFADMLMDFHLSRGFDSFKIDGVFLRSYAAARNLGRMLSSVGKRSRGRVSFYMDVTNGQRGGFFQFIERGVVFLENRYVKTGGAMRYDPERLLLNAWSLSRYVPMRTLQLETADCGDSDYSLEYRMAITLFAHPLLWMAPSLVPAERRPRYRAMAELSRKHGAEIFAGEIYPVGMRPDGASLTGFYADSGYLLIFREKGCLKQKISLDIPAGRWELLAGDGKISGRSVTMPRPASFALFKLNV
jgi:hypothetical protein